MTILNRQADYALLLLAYLHEHPEGGCARVIAARYSLSQAFVANILKRLCQKGFVHSQRGLKGGYKLSRPAESIYLAELLEACESPLHLTECCRESLPSSCTLYGVCPVQGPIGQIQQRLRALLAQVTLAELFSSGTAAPIVELSTVRCQSRPVVLGEGY